MVRLEEVLDEEFTRDPTGPLEGEDDWDTDSDSDADSTTSSLPETESLTERLAALQDIIPPSYRRSIATTVSTTSSYVRSSLLFGGKALWVVSTSALLLAVPWALAYGEEQQMLEMEKEMKMQQDASNLLTGNGEQGQSSEAKPAL